MEHYGNLDLVGGKLTADQVWIDGNRVMPTVKVAAATDSVDVTESRLVKWKMVVIDSNNSANMVAAEILAMNNGSAVDFTDYGYLELGAMTMADVDVSVVADGDNTKITVSIAGGSSITGINVTLYRDVFLN